MISWYFYDYIFRINKNYEGLTQWALLTLGPSVIPIPDLNHKIFTTKASTQKLFSFWLYTCTSLKTSQQKNFRKYVIYDDDFYKSLYSFEYITNVECLECFQWPIKWSLVPLGPSLILSTVLNHLTLSTKLSLAETIHFDYGVFKKKGLFQWDLVARSLSLITTAVLNHQNFTTKPSLSPKKMIMEWLK